MKIAYVILHYMAGKDTIECAESILTATKSSEHKSLVIIVDNGSMNDSLKEITSTFKGKDNVKILHSKENLGFAKGNNIGFSYAKNKYQADFIVQLNNDTVLRQSNFNEVLVEKYNRTSYGVLGPDIITADGFHQNPVQDPKWTIKTLRKCRLKKYIRIILFYLHLDEIVNRLQKSKGEVYRDRKLDCDEMNAMLHGACLIFSPKYIKKFDGLEPRTFLYMEEDILKLYMDHYGLLMMYSGEIEIYHKEDISTKHIGENERKRSIWHDKNIIASSKIYEQIKKEIQNET